MVRGLRALALAAALAIGAAAAAPAQGCRLALLLALDVSSSVDDAEYKLQKEGLAGALSDPDIRGAILDGNERVALAVYEWSGRHQSATVLDWTLLDGPTALDGAVARILSAPRSYNRFPTAMGFALGYGANLLERAPSCTRKVIDVSGDGITNDGFRPQQAYVHFPFADVVVNGLAVLGSDPRVADYYRGEVAHGPGAFVEVAEGYADFRRAMTLKLFRELNDMVVGRLGPGLR
ncbi:DUF1194 domain-containing protein [Salipiger mucosus]|uniref:Identified by similarity to GB.1 n=1 Tax=Salipiger mucosus DSM 16094 TaxID=1123237 RepID=S9QDZ6_9RHOB|nr:DUF1194 domain-containing protein [Salipiger mucosus]EPX79651.1 identified by similarity to GB.1 [Salipiger mucosus DSM 16094]